MSQQSMIISIIYSSPSFVYLCRLSTHTIDGIEDTNILHQTNDSVSKHRLGISSVSHLLIDCARVVSNYLPECHRLVALVEFLCQGLHILNVVRLKCDCDLVFLSHFSRPWIQVGHRKYHCSDVGLWNIWPSLVWVLQFWHHPSVGTLDIRTPPL